MIYLQQLSLRRGSQLLLENVDLTIFTQQRVGFVGANGSGKSSLFSLIRGELLADSGKLILPPKITIAHLEQETPALKKSAIEFVIDGDVELRQIEQQLITAEEAHDGIAIAHLHTQLANIDGYTANARAAQLLAGLGFTNKEFT